MAYESSIRAVNLLIRDYVANSNISSNSSRADVLVNRRLTAKFEEPRSDNANRRRTDAWERWITFDDNLGPRGLLGPSWAKARLLVRQYLSGFRMGELTFTNGSAFEPLGTKTSVACKLTGDWSITADCFDLFAKYSFWHRALKHAVKKRFASYCRNNKLGERAINRRLYLKFKHKADFNYEIFKFKLFCTVKFVRGNRWSTVPENNQKDRSICLEPFCNMLVQRAVGLGIRDCLKNNLGIDLDYLAEKHRDRISDSNVATIDLSDCSDAISVKLITYLLPYRVLKYVLSSRSEMTLGPDDNYYFIKKVSSMGNGFTFDLMTLVLTALTRVFDHESTVFGDDIICCRHQADEVIRSLQLAGFVVNLDKTNVNTGYRESCGAHFVDGYGYVTSFDFKWITDIHELISTVNKVGILAHIYGEPYESLRASIWTCLPRSLLGAATLRLVVDTGRPPAYELSGYVRYGPQWFVDPTSHVLKSIRKKLRPLQKSGRISIALGFQSRLASPRTNLASSEWDVFFQYIRNSRLSRKVKRVSVKSSLVARVDEEQIDFVNALLP